jgi:mRNA interferase RelE/StbE
MSWSKRLSYKILIDDKVIKDLKKIDRGWQKRIVEKIRNTLSTDPYQGKRLVGTLSPYWRIRVGDYRIVYSIDDTTVTVEVILIRHRKEVYR